MAEFFAAIRGVAKHPEQFKVMINCCEKLHASCGTKRRGRGLCKAKGGQKRAMVPDSDNGFCAAEPPSASSRECQQKFAEGRQGLFKSCHDQSLLTPPRFPSARGRAAT
jgi:hypothetical protein